MKEKYPKYIAILNTEVRNYGSKYYHLKKGAQVEILEKDLPLVWHPSAFFLCKFPDNSTHYLHKRDLEIYEKV